MGAGAGSIACWLAARVAPSGQVVATDIDPRFLQNTTRPNLEVRRHDIRTDALESDAYDLVHCRNLLIHLPNPEQSARRMVAALRPGGWLMAEEPDLTAMVAVSRDHPAADNFDSFWRRVYVHALPSKLTGNRPGHRVISWASGRAWPRAEIRFPATAVPIRQGPAPPARSRGRPEGPRTADRARPRDRDA
jgi:SAM-dependent methyltransferase